MLCQSKVGWRFRKILLPSQNTGTLTFRVELTVFSFVFFENATKLKPPPDFYPPLFFLLAYRTPFQVPLNTIIMPSIAIKEVRVLCALPSVDY